MGPSGLQVDARRALRFGPGPILRRRARRCLPGSPAGRHRDRDRSRRCRRPEERQRNECRRRSRRGADAAVRQGRRGSAAAVRRRQGRVGTVSDLPESAARRAGRSSSRAGQARADHGQAPHRARHGTGRQPLPPAGLGRDRRRRRNGGSRSRTAGEAAAGRLSHERQHGHQRARTGLQPASLGHPQRGAAGGEGEQPAARRAPVDAGPGPGQRRTERPGSRSERRSTRASRRSP